MKILFVSEPGLDGVFRHVECLATLLMERGHQVSLAYSSVRGSDRLYRLAQHIEHNGGSTIDLRVGNDPSPADLSAIFRLLSFYRKVAPDIVHAHSAKAGLLVRTSRLLGLKAPIFYTPHAYYKMGSGIRGLKTRLVMAVEYALARIGTTTNLCSTEMAFAQKKLRVPRSRIRIIYNGVDCELFAPPTGNEKRDMRRFLGLPDDALVLGTVGRFSAQKDPLTLYKAFAMVERSERQVLLAHLGKGELVPEVDRFIHSARLNDRVIRVDYSPSPAAFYRALDGFVLSSRYEGMSYALLEALATNLPLLLTRAPGNIDFADFDLSHVYWTTAGNPASLASAIHDWRKRVHETPNHREIALEKFTEDRCVDSVLACYEEGQKR